MDKRFLLVLLVVLGSTASADISAKFSSSCGSYEPVISASDPSKEYSHPGTPSTYNKKLCISGIESSKITEDSCGKNVGFYLSSKGRDAHLSFNGAYRLKVCTGRMKTRVTSPLGACSSNETALFSVSPVDGASPRSNLHIGETGLFDRLVCGSVAQPENVTLEMEFNLSGSDNVYFSGERVEGNKTFTSSDYPYLVSEGDGFVSGIVKRDFIRAERKLEGHNTLSMTSGRGSASFLVPFSSGSIGDIENREEEIEKQEFVSHAEPAFSYVLPTQPTVRVILDPDSNLSSGIDTGPGSYSFEIEKTGENTADIEVLE